MLAGTADRAPPHVAPEKPRPARDEDLELSCIFCHQRAGAREKVIYWPPARGRVGFVAHARCYAEAVSL